MIKTPSTDRPSAIHVSQFTAAKLLVLGAVGVLLYVAHQAFIPIALALLAALVLSGLVEALLKFRIPRSLSATVILIAFLAASAGLVDLMWAPAQQWYLTAPATMKIIKRKLSPAAKFISRIEEIRASAGTITGAPGTAAPSAAPAAVPNEGSPALILDATRGIMVSVLTFVIVTLFLLAGGPPMIARMTAAFVDDLNAAHVLDVIEKVRKEVGRFYVTTAIINIGLGLATAGLMTMLGMPTPYLWGIVAATLNFIPYAGPATTLILLTLVATVSFDKLGQVAAVSVSYTALAAVEGQIIQPLFVGRRLEVNPLLIFLALWFGGLFWGIAGVILATPALVALKVVAEHALRGTALMEFLGPNDQTPNKRKGLQRLVPPMKRRVKAAQGSTDSLT
ncbi:MAG TPA: AI-2E family transporter [Steroidobacteraceae bacterium]